MSGLLSKEHLLALPSITSTLGWTPATLLRNVKSPWNQQIRVAHCTRKLREIKLNSLRKRGLSYVKAKTRAPPQDLSKATVHRKSEVAKISCIELDRTYRAGDLINLIRARTYPPYPSAYYIEGDRRTYVRMELLRENQLSDPELTRTFPQGNLDAQFRAEDLLNLLGIPESSPNHFVRFAHESGPIFVRSYIVDEREFDTSASPAWMNEPLKVAAGAC